METRLMKAENRQIFLAGAGALGLHLMLVLLWLLMPFIIPGSLMTRKIWPSVASPAPVITAEKEPEEVEIVLVPDNESGSITRRKPFVLAPDGTVETMPADSDPDFVSSQNMSAASTKDADENADPAKIATDGVDIIGLSLASVTFSDGPPNNPPPPPPSPPVIEKPPAAQTREKPSEPTLMDLPPDPSFKPDRRERSAPAMTTPQPPEKIVMPPQLKMREESAPDVVKQSPPPRPPVPLAPPTPANTGQPRAASVRTRSLGGNRNRGPQASVDAVATAEGKYGAILHDRVGMIWNRKLATMRGLAGTGAVEVDFEIDSDGKVSNVRLVEPGGASAILEDICLGAILAAKLPPLPEELRQTLDEPLSGGKLRRRFTFQRL